MPRNTGTLTLNVKISRTAAYSGVRVWGVMGCLCRRSDGPIEEGER